MKTLLSLLLVAAGTGFVFRDQFSTWLHLPRNGKEEVYYLRTAHQTTNPDGTVVRWAPGQPLRVTTQATAAAGAVALTDGANILQVPRNVLTRDANEATTLRQTDLVSENTARMQVQQEAARQANEEFQVGSQSSGTYRSGPVATASAPVFYYPIPVYVRPAVTPNPGVQNRSAAADGNRASTVATPWPRHRGNTLRPSPTPGR